MRLSIVIPVYCEEMLIEQCHARIKKALESLSKYEHEIIFVNDGSTDQTLTILKNISSNDPSVRVVSLSRNFGHQIALTAGLDIASGDAVVVIDADLQDPPELIPEMIKKWEEGYKVVYAQRTKRKGETRFKLWTASLFYRFMRKMTDVNIPVDTGDFRLMDKKVVDHLRSFRERSRFIRGIVSWIGFKQTAVEYVREERLNGETKYPFRKMLKFAIDGITSFSHKPLKMALTMGIVSTTVGLLLICYALISKLFFTQTTLSGWTSLLLVVVFFGGIQLSTIGIIGEYIARIYDETKQRPLYIVEEEWNGKH
ncbi:glycosyltransferase family 2 protein [bacterium]|nr:glycosyltransferase family 2 protein [bacterium]